MKPKLGLINAFLVTNIPLAMRFLIKTPSFLSMMIAACRQIEKPAECLNTLRTGHLNCLNARSRGLNNLKQLLYCVSLNIYNKFTTTFVN